MNFRILLLVIWAGTASAQQIGLHTTTPDAPVHIWSSGQVETPGGLLLLGDRTEAHMELDFNRIQSLFGQTGTTLPLRLQPGGGNVGINIQFPNSIDRKLQVNGDAGFNDFLYHNGDLDTWIRLTNDEITFEAGGRQLMRLTEDAQDEINMAGGTGVNVNIGDGMLFVEGASEQIGLGTTTPNARLDVIADANEIPLSVLQVNISRLTVASDGQVGVGIISPSARLQIDSDLAENALRARVGGSTKFLVHNNGGTSIGESLFTPESTLHVRHGNSNVEDKGLSIGNNAADVRWMFHAQANQNMVLYADNGPNFALHGTFLWALGDYIPASDQRMKKNIEDVQTVLDRVKQLQPRKYNMLVEEDGDLKSMGFVAQEVQGLFPENVRYDEVADKYYVIYRGFSVVAIKAIQELAEQADQQQLIIEQLHKDREDLNRRLALLEEQVSRIIPDINNN